MALQIKTTQVIECYDWDKLVVETYKRPYCFQQQNDCQQRGTYNLVVPGESDDDGMHDEIPEIVNGPKMGVKFAKWLERDPQQPLKDDDDGQSAFSISLWWDRNFYPDIQTIANDLHNKGLLPAGKYLINIDW